MATDHKTAKFQVNITLTVVPLNQYGDVLGGGQFEYSTEIMEPKLSDVLRRIERLNEPGGI